MHFHCGLGTAVAEWLTCCVTNGKVAGSIADGVSGFSIDIRTSDRTVTLGTTLPLTELITRNISLWWRRTVLRLTTYHHPVFLSLNLRPLTSWNLLGLLRPVMGLFKFTFYHCGLKWHLLDRQTGGSNGIMLRNIRIYGRNWMRKMCIFIAFILS